MSTILVCVTSGRGPAECRAAVAEVVAALQREAASAGVDCAAEANPMGDKPSVLISLGGEGAAALLRDWEGTVQCVADSRMRPHHRRKNWFVAVHRVPEPPAVPDLLPGDLVFETRRAGGPGGQHQNRTESAVRVVHKPTGASAIARDDRCQHRNRALAVARLRAVLAGMQERERNAGRFREWLARIQVERGNPVRVI
ncbi:peptide chain release factor H [Labrys miyagiensis]|uniref:Peptide chain release factor H n=1 Tax=Labrys miyagiensis TaxID=346912 RepID=A0ABQ6CUP2_9HYPH|nr:peptide chain release factor H [Labrys miyagiensis]GLS21966.1 peptide chain release factor H [Labrys miyagiensis]